VKQCRIAVSTVINWSFLNYICCFSIGLFPSNFIDSESGVTLCNQFPIRRPDTWHHSTCHGSYLPISDPFEQSLSTLQPFSSYCPLSVLGLRPWPFRVTWRHRSRDHFIPRYPFPIGAPLSPNRYLQPFSRYWPLSVLGSRPWPFGITWRHRSRDHLIPKWPFTIGAPLVPTRYLQPFSR